ncbi:MAG: glycosyl hydrolase family 17, partial [Cyclobacteriaceae bacterium]
MKAIRKSVLQSICLGLAFAISISCNPKHKNQSDKPVNQKEVTAKDILGNPNYLAICYEGYREKSRELQPTIAQLQEDLKILSAMGIKIVRTYNVQLAHASNLLKAIHELKQSDPTFEMYVMLGAWIDCKNAWTDQAPDHNIESDQNEGEIARAVALANQYPDIVKILAVGNEAMIRWAASYYVQPSVILKWV